MQTDEKTRKKGEKPKPAEYLVLLQLEVQPTTMERDGHSLGRIVRVVQGYCALHHWGDGRPAPKPATIENCAWIAGSRGRRSANVAEPVTYLTCQKLPQTLEEAEERNKKK
eukprot:scaffold113536_cov54-Attheya_sp.AAC.2